MDHYVYNQLTGILTLGDVLIGTGWAGNDYRPDVNPTGIHGKNNPEAQHIHNIGPLPRGFYTIKEPIRHPRLGPLAFKLIPDEGNEMFGRSDFWMHGAGGDHPERASEGCIIQAREVREGIAKSSVRRLEVI